ncbi:hypothetical protein G9F71_008680 [Clostridium sp. FP2]|uniref:hypothetical protein n=1 Tax=Clostridium sp. FP2 TaxID=2724481 RepID=UPI0013E9477A|nr:hypothetical protein [Clostridium sp. FP2]MBZ9622928.1 hypothetical protein [Clostridium sp. FP2]
MKNKINITQMANIVANEAGLLHCTIENAWNGINKNITEHFDFEEVKSLIENFNS